MNGKTWAQSCEELQNTNKEVEMETIVKHVGPIYGRFEAADKVNQYNRLFIVRDCF